MASVGKRQTSFTTARVEALVVRYEAGASVVELAGEFGVHRRTVLRQLKRAGVEVRRRGLSPAQVERARQLRLDGLTLTEISTRFGVSASTICRRLRQSPDGDR